MVPYESNKTHCPCCKECCECEDEFKRVMNFRKTGLVIYRHSVDKKNVPDNADTKAESGEQTMDVFILQNTTDMSITSTECLVEIDINDISCPRCRIIIDRVQKLLLKVPTINKYDVLGICNHCLHKGKSCLNCKKAVEKFYSTKKALTNETEHRIRTWHSKIKGVLKENRKYRGYYFKNVVPIDDENVLTIASRPGTSTSEAYERQPVNGEPKTLILKTQTEEDDKRIPSAPHVSKEKRIRLMENIPPVPFVSNTDVETLRTDRYALTYDNWQRPSIVSDDLDLYDTIYFTRKKENDEFVNIRKIKSADLASHFNVQAYYAQSLSEKWNKTKKRNRDDFSQTFKIPRDSRRKDQAEQEYHQLTDIVMDYGKMLTDNIHTKDTNERDERATKVTFSKKTGDEERQFNVENYVDDLSPTESFEDVRHDPSRKPHAPSIKYEKHKDDSNVESTRRTDANKKLKEDEKFKSLRKYHSLESLFMTNSKPLESEYLGEDKEGFKYIFPIKKSDELDDRQHSSSSLIKETLDKIAKIEDEKMQLEIARLRKQDLDEKVRIAREEKLKQAEEKKRLEPKKGWAEEDDRLKLEVKESPDEKMQKSVATSVVENDLKIYQKEAIQKSIKAKQKEKDTESTVGAEPIKGAKIYKALDKDTKKPVKQTLPKENTKEVVKKTKTSATSLREKGLKVTKPEAKKLSDSRSPMLDKFKKEKVKKKETFTEMTSQSDLKKKPREVMGAIKDDEVTTKGDQGEIKGNQGTIKGNKDVIKADKSAEKEKKQAEDTQSKLKDTAEIKKKENKMTETNVKDFSNNDEKRKAAAPVLKIEKINVPPLEEKTQAKAAQRGQVDADLLKGKKLKKDEQQPTQSVELNKVKIIGEADNLKVQFGMNEGKAKGSENAPLFNKHLTSTGIGLKCEKDTNMFLKEIEALKQRELNAKFDSDFVKEIEVKMEHIKIRKPSTENADLILKLVKLKQPEQKPKDTVERDIVEVFGKETVGLIDSHKKYIFHRPDLFPRKDIFLNIIFGNKLIKAKHLLENVEELKIPMLFKSDFVLDELQTPPRKSAILGAPIENEKDKKKTDQLIKLTEQAQPGVTHYVLSDRSFIEKGWTVLPIEKIVRKINKYRMRPAHPEFDWFEHNKKKELMLYDSGERLAQLDEDGRGRWYYKNGRVALDYYNCEEPDANQRIVIYSSGEPDERGKSRPYTVLAMFDYSGNGVVFDHAGKIRLKYNQSEGILLDRNIGPVTQWKWHSLNDPPVLQQVMIDTQLPHKEPEILKYDERQKNAHPPEPSDIEDMLALEFEKFLKEKQEKLCGSYQPFQIRMKALKLNEQFSLRILDQSRIHIIYREGKTNLKLNIGMILDHKEIIGTEFIELGEVSNTLERFPACTGSIDELQQNIADAKLFDHIRNKHEYRIQRPQPSASIDKLNAALSRPLQRPLCTVGTSSKATTPTESERCKCTRKPTSCAVYYDTRLF